MDDPSRADARESKMPLTLKFDDDEQVVVVDGKPVYLDDDGKEIAFDAPGTVATITRLNGEAKGHREAKEEALAKLKLFDGIEDPKAAKAALEKLKTVDFTKLVGVDKVEEVRAEVAKAYETKLADKDVEIGDLKSTLDSEMIGGSFARSKFIAEKIAVPVDIVQARFGKSFKIEDGQIAAYGADKNKIYSKSKPGEAASFEEALEILIDQYPHKDQILKGNSGGGGGASSGGGGGGAKTMTRSVFEQLTAREQSAKILKDRVKIVD